MPSWLFGWPPTTHNTQHTTHNTQLVTTFVVTKNDDTVGGHTTPFTLLTRPHKQDLVGMWVATHTKKTKNLIVQHTTYKHTYEWHL